MVARQTRWRGTCSSGLTLVELMVSLALGLLVILVTTGLLLSARTGYLTQDDEVQLHDSARYALEVIARSLRQTAYENWDTTTAPVIATDTMSPNISGLNASRLTSNGNALEKLTTPVINGSDVLAVRFFGSGPVYDGDGTVLNCAGFPVAAPVSQEVASEARGWSIFYVGKASSGESVLYCKYLGKGSAKKAPSWSAESIATGVESFQLLYGVDLDGAQDGIPDRYMHAGELAALDAGLTLEGANLAEKALDLNRKSHWKKVVVVRVALLMRGNHNVRVDEPDQVYDLFGAQYSEAFGAKDPGTRLSEAGFPAAERSRPRRVFGATIQLRNRTGGSGA